MRTDQNVPVFALNNLAKKVFSLLSANHSQQLLITDTIILIQVETGFESVGIRLHDGLDYPYYFTRGFAYDFIDHEQYLCARDQYGEVIRDGNGAPILECMCGNVIMGKTDPSLPFFTEGGSFWSNCTSDLLANTTEKERQSRTRNRCNRAGYESVALFPIKTGGEILGLIQLNDHRKNMFNEDFIIFMEGISVIIALLFSIVRQQESLKELRLAV